MKTLNLKIELNYDDKNWHGKDREAKEWFFNEVLSEGKLELFSDEVGDMIGEVKILGGMNNETKT